MDKWLTKDGLSAVFWDVADLPANVIATVYDRAREIGFSKLKSSFLAAGWQTAPALIGLGMGLSGGPLTGLAAYYGVNMVKATLLSASPEINPLKLAPRCAAHASL